MAPSNALAHKSSSTTMARKSNVTLFDAQIKWPNFSGLEGRFNAEGNRNFAIFLTPAQAKDLEAHGYPVKYLDPREEGDDPQAMLKVKVKYTERSRPPKIVMINSRGQIDLPEDSVGIIDWMDIEKADVIVRAYDWDFNGKQGTTAYANTVYVTIREDELEQRYAHVPIDSAKTAITENIVYEGELVDEDGDQLTLGR